MTDDEWRALLRRWHIADEEGEWRLADRLLKEIERRSKERETPEEKEKEE